MEQSIKSVLVKQTIAHQQQQLTNLQVSRRPPSTPSHRLLLFLSCACGSPPGVWSRFLKDSSWGRLGPPQP